jgi:PAS domain S-box-containing protein
MVVNLCYHIVMQEKTERARFPWEGIVIGIVVFFISAFLWDYYSLLEYAPAQKPGLLFGGLIGTIVFLLITYRSLTNFIATRLTKDIYSSREWFRNLYDYAQIPYMLLADDGHVRLPNKAALRLYGTTYEKLYEQAFADIFFPEDRELAAQYFAYFRAPHPVIDREIRIRRDDGTVRFVLLSIFPLSIQGQGEHIGLVSLIDITNRKEIEQAKSDFVSLAAHQLRTPLATVKWYLEGLLGEKKEPLTEKQTAYIDKIYRKNQAIVDLVDLLLNVSRIEAGAFHINAKETSPRTLVAAILENQSLYIKQKGIATETKFADMDSFSTDPKLLSIVLENLISNAVKYTPVKGSIIIRTEQKDGGLEFSVTDSGYGIPKDSEEKIFTKLFRADNAQLVDPDGSGLGLYLTKRIVEALGGSISFASEENKGTTFTVSIPDRKSVV